MDHATTTSVKIEGDSKKGLQMPAITTCYSHPLLKSNLDSPSFNRGQDGAFIADYGDGEIVNTGFLGTNSENYDDPGVGERVYTGEQTCISQNKAIDDANALLAPGAPRAPNVKCSQYDKFLSAEVGLPATLPDQPLSAADWQYGDSFTHNEGILSSIERIADRLDGDQRDQLCAGTGDTPMEDMPVTSCMFKPGDAKINCMPYVSTTDQSADITPTTTSLVVEDHHDFHPKRTYIKPGGGNTGTWVDESSHVPGISRYKGWVGGIFTIDGTTYLGGELAFTYGGKSAENDQNGNILTEVEMIAVTDARTGTVYETGYVFEGDGHHHVANEAREWWSVRVDPDFCRCSNPAFVKWRGSGARRSDTRHTDSLSRHLSSQVLDPHIPRQTRVRSN